MGVVSDTKDPLVLVINTIIILICRQQQLKDHQRRRENERKGGMEERENVDVNMYTITIRSY
jgi:hypothetical protein